MISKGAMMEEKQGWERPGYFLNDQIVTVPNYDWYGNYGHAKHETNVYLDKLLGEHKYEFSDNHELVRRNISTIE